MTWTFPFFFFSSRRRHTRLQGDWSSDVCSSDLRRVLYLNYSAVDPALTNERCSFWHFRFDAHADRKSTRLNSSHLVISYAVFCLKKKKNDRPSAPRLHRAHVHLWCGACLPPLSPLLQL